MKFIFIFISFSFLAAQGFCGQTANLEKARELYGSGKINSALEILYSNLKKNPSDTEGYSLFLEIVPEGISKYNQSLLEITSEQLKKDPENFLYYLGLCKTARNNNLKNQSLSRCRKALSLEPTAYPVYRELGLTYLKNGNHAKAVETFYQGAEISSDTFKPYFYLAEAYFKTGKTGSAAGYYKKASSVAAKTKEPDSGLFAAVIQKRIKQLAKYAPAARSKNPKVSFEECMDKAKSFENSGNLLDAEKQYSLCLTIKNSSAQARLALANVLSGLGKNKEAVDAYGKAAKLLSSDKILLSYCRFKTAESLKALGDVQGSLWNYKKAYELNAMDVNVLTALARHYESAGDFKSAMKFYGEILKIEPSNKTAEEKLWDIQTAAMSNAEILAELKERKAAKQNKPDLTEEDVSIFKAIRNAEKNNAVDYMKYKVMMLPEYTVEKTDASGKTKLLLTMKGYKIYIKLLSQEAVKLFESKEMNLKQVFLLRDLKGRSVFDRSGELTIEGHAVYFSTLKGEKSYLLEDEPAPSPETEKETARIQGLAKQGYQEISEPEFLWLMKATDCPPEELVKYNYLRILPASDKHAAETAAAIRRFAVISSAGRKTAKYDRYFLCWQNDLCGAAKLAFYIEKYRNGQTDIADGHSTAFFGIGQTERRKFCKDGKIWTGD
ncbi:MAG: hypothetical protein HY746_04540 [Elusimicrobia bacterium]|nr:hypothetical protein [Elusimicrobiota bacterium]